MDLNRMMSTIGRALDAKLFALGGTTVTIKTIVIVVLILIFAGLLSKLLCRGISRLLKRRGVQDEGSIEALTKLVHYAVLLVGTGIALQTAGFNLNALFAAGAVFAIGIGFAMQNVAQNFVAGVILLIERAIKPGDVLEVNGQVVRVVALGIRATIVRAWNGEHLIVPNSSLVQAAVKNYSIRGGAFRVHATVGVVYGADMKLVREVLTRTAEAMPWRLQDQPPVILMTEFGNSSVNFDVSAWSNDPWDQRRLRSELYERVWWALKEAGIVIAFPQVDVHFDQPVAEGLAKLAVVK